MAQEEPKGKKISKVVKFIFLIIANCLMIFLGIACISLWILVESYNEKWSNPGIIGPKSEMTLNQDFTIVNPGNPDASITLKKDTVISGANISERGVLYSNERNGVRYHEYIPFDYFVESGKLKDQLKQDRETEQAATIKELCFSAVYLAISVPVTVILFRKKRYRTTLLINFILMIGAYFLSKYIYLWFH